MKKHLLLILIILLGAFVRLWYLSDVPDGLTWDEAAIGYNAYSLLKTGRDEHGALLPIVFKSFGDYKPGAYIYLTVPSVAFFGLNEFAVRFPSALFGILGILGVYLLVLELTKEKRLSELAALATAVSPWLVHFSHGAWETNVFVNLLVFGVYYYLRFINNKSSLIPTLLLACLSLAMYQGAKLLVPLIYLLLILLYKQEFLSKVSTYFNSKKFINLLPFLIFGFWIYAGALFGSAGNRLSSLSIFNYRPQIVADSTYFHNQFLLSTRLVVSRYLYHFSPEVLFYEGSSISERAHIPGAGLLNPLEFITLLLGIIYLLRSKNKKLRLFLIWSLLLAPIPGSLTLSEFSPVRSLFMALPLAIISGLGFYFLSTWRWLFSIPVAFLYTISAIYIFDLYYFHSQTAFAPEFNYGYKQAVMAVLENPTPKVYFTDVYGQPYIYYLFYSKYDPAKYQRTDHFIDGGLDVGKVGRVDHIQYQQFGISELSNEKNVMFVGTEGNIDKTFDIAGDNVVFFKQIETPDKKIIFRIVKTKP